VASLYWHLVYHEPHNAASMVQNLHQASICASFLANCFSKYIVSAVNAGCWRTEFQTNPIYLLSTQNMNWDTIEYFISLVISTIFMYHLSGIISR
jgi:hypothetical protein